MLNKRLGEDASAVQCPDQRRTRTGGGKLCKYFLNLDVLHQFFSWTQTDILCRVMIYALCCEFYKVKTLLLMLMMMNGTKLCVTV